MNYLAFIFTLCIYLSLGLTIDMAFTAPLISDYNETKSKKEKIPVYFIIPILVLMPLIYPLPVIIFCITALCSNIKERFHNYFNLN